jgi:hypothetical protein
MKITKNDVGKIIKLNNGDVTIITEFNEKDPEFPIEVLYGKAVNELDILKFFEPNIYEKIH